MNGNVINRLFFGLVLIGIGVLFILNSMNIITVDLHYIFSTFWPVLLIYAGLHGGLSQRRREWGRGGLVSWNGFLIVLGLIFLGRNLDFIHFQISDIYAYIIPVLLILFGIQMIFRTGRDRDGDRVRDRDRDRHRNRNRDRNQGLPETEVVAADEIRSPEPQKHQNHFKHENSWESPGVYNQSNFIGDIYLGHEQWELKPSNISHFIGDTVIDLTKAQIPAGEIRMNVSSFIGDVSVYIPSDMDLGIKVTSSTFIGDTTVFQQHEGGMFRNLNSETPYYKDADRKIHLIISRFIGDVTIQRVG